MNPQQRAFLAAFRETGNVRLACDVAKAGRSSHYRWLEKDPEYREKFDLVKEDAADILEAEAYRRADIPSSSRVFPRAYASNHWFDVTIAR